MDYREKSRKIADYIGAVNSLIHTKHHELAQKHNLTLDQFHLLIHLDRDSNPPTIGEIAQRSNKAQNTVSEKVARLEEKGLVRREKDSNDRRVSRVVMSKEGISLINSISNQARYEFITDAIGKMDNELVNNLVNGLQKLIQELNNNRG